MENFNLWSVCFHILRNVLPLCFPHKYSEVSLNTESNGDLKIFIKTIFKNYFNYFFK